MSDRLNLSLFAGGIAVWMGVLGAAAAPAVTICHYPPGNPENVQTINVGAQAVAAHVNDHGDVVCADGSSDCCGATCTNRQTDPSNCGSCGNACAAEQTCSDGVCGEGPNPECSGATCGSFMPCNPGTACENPVCATTAEGGGVCIEGTTPCDGLTDCNTSNDCQAGEVCGVGSCCGRPVCVPVGQFCRAP